MAKGSGVTRSSSSSNPSGVGSKKNYTYYDKALSSAQSKYDKLNSELEASYPQWQRRNDYNAGGEARARMEQAVKPVNDAYRALNDLKKEYEEWRNKQSKKGKSKLSQSDMQRAL